MNVKASSALLEGFLRGETDERNPDIALKTDRRNREASH